MRRSELVSVERLSVTTSMKFLLLLTAAADPFGAAYGRALSSAIPE
jgi:hypothetical protein